MKRIYYVVDGVFLLLLAASLTLNAKYIHQDICKNNQTIEDETVVPKNKVIASKDVTLLRAGLSISSSPGTSMEGWFIDHLKEKLGIEVVQADISSGMFDGCEEGVDLCWLDSYVSYYDAVREGKLKNLEDDLMKKWPQIYQRYHVAIDRMKADTYKHTGKKGIFGIPTWLQSFNDTGREGYCLVIPTGSPHPELAMELIMYSASDDGIMDIAFGPEGQMWEKRDGRYVLLQDWMEISKGNPAKKFVETKDGMEDFVTAVCKLELVGNEKLGRELLAMSSVNKLEEMVQK